MADLEFYHGHMALQNDHEFLPTEVARAVFPSAFRGYDQEAVRRYLTRLAESLEHQLGLQGLEALEGHAPTQDRIEQLESELSEHQEQIESLEADLAEAVALAENGVPAEAPEIDEAQAIAWLGKETARVLESARAAAADIVVNAEAKAESMRVEAAAELSSAQEQADMLRSEAETEVQERVASLTSEAELRASGLVSEAEERATVVTTEAEQHAASVKSEAEKLASGVTTEADEYAARVKLEAEESAATLSSEADEYAAKAISEADETIAAARAEAEAALTSAASQAAVVEADARQRADQIIELAYGRRQDLLSGFVGKRRQAQEELEVLVGAKAELTEALREAQEHLALVVTELETTGTNEADKGSSSDLGESAADESAEQEVERLIADLDATLPDLPELLAPAQPAVAEPAVAQPDKSGSGKSGAGQEPRAKKPSARSEAGRVSKAKPRKKAPAKKQAQTSSPTEAVKKAETPEVNTKVSTENEPSESSDKLASLVEGFTTIDVLSELSAQSSEPVVAETKAVPDEDSSESGATPRPAIDPALLKSLVVASSDPAQLITTVSARAGTKQPDGRRGDFELEEPSTDPIPSWFSARDAAISRSGPNVRRHLRRVLNDDQSDVMDRLRNGHGAITVEDLPPAEEQLDRFLAAVRKAISDVVKAGARAGGGESVAEPVLANLCQQLAAHLVDQVRLPVVATVAEVEHDDRELVLEPIRTLYRDMRNIHLPDLADDAMHEAFAIGLYEAIEPGSAVQWSVDPRTDPDPVCDINRNRLDLTKGEVFPSGHLRPLSLPGCRCLVIGREPEEGSEAADA